MKRIISITITLCLVAVGIYLYTKYRVAPKIAFENLALTTLEGSKIGLPKNKKLVINFFATWCGPCIAEMPSLQQAEAELKNNGFEVICISDEKVERLSSYKSNSGNTLQILRSEQKLVSFGINTIPATYVLNEKGEIVYKQTGQENWASPQMLKKVISKAE